MRKEIQEHFERLDREVVNINNEAARNYLALNDKMNDVLQAVVELKNLIRQEEGGTPLMCSGITARDIALADIQPIEETNREETEKESDKGGHEMIICMKGEPKELAEFAKDMQWPIAAYGCELKEAEETEEAAKETQAEVEKEVERLFDAAKSVTGENTQLRTIPVELHWIDLANLMAEANKRGMTGCELAEQIINDWLDKQKKARV